MMGIAITDKLVPLSPLDEYPTHDSLYGVGGYREVDTILDRDNIPQARRRAGMLVYVRTGDTIWKLKSDMQTWEILQIQGNLTHMCLEELVLINTINEPELCMARDSIMKVRTQ